MPNTILLMDNDEKALQKWGKLLEADGYLVRLASSLEQAEQILRHEWIHLAILDIRMANEDDENDISGLQLAQEPEFLSVPKIILTAYPSYEYVRAVLAPGGDGQTAAVNFVAKDEEPRKLREAVQKAFSEQVRLNWDLQIQCPPQQGLTFASLASLLQQNLTDEAWLQRADELEGLFRRLFFRYPLIRTGPLIWHDGGRACLPVLTRSSQGAVHSRMLICGELAALRREKKRLDDLAPSGEQDTKLIGSAETMRFGALLYDLPDADATAVQPMNNLISWGGRGPARLALLSLLKTVQSWHDQGQTTEDTEDLMALYRRRAGLPRDGLPQSEVERRVADLVQAVRPLDATEIELDEEALTFHFAGPKPVTLICPNPVSIVYQQPEWQNGPVVCKVSPGVLGFDKILVDPQQRAWLSDFSQAGQAPQWWDYICLEASIRFDLSPAPDLMAYQDLEECLVAPGGLHGGLLVQNIQRRELQGNATLIQEIRQQAGSDTGSSILPYYAGLLAWAVGAMTQYSSGTLYTQAELMRGAHLLLAAGMIARRMEELSQEPEQEEPPQVGGSGQEVTHTLTLEKDKVTVRIGPDYRVRLSGQELELFRCLYEQAGQVVPREVLVKAVFEEEFDSADTFQQRRLNSLVRRLREKIEIGPGTSRHIHSVRGQGYRLERS